MNLNLAIHNFENSILNIVLSHGWLTRWVFLFVGLPLFILISVFMLVFVFAYLLTILGL